MSTLVRALECTLKEKTTTEEDEEQQEEHGRKHDAHLSIIKRKEEKASRLFSFQATKSMLL